MKEKICLIYQPCGLGDILFVQKIVKHYIDLGFKIIYPVIHEYSWLSDYIKDVTFVSWNDIDVKLTHHDKLPDNVIFPYKERYDPFSPSYFSDDFVFLNFFEPIKGRVMEHKYNIAKIDYNDWEKCLTFERNDKKEDDLFYNILGLNDNDDYVFINRNYMLRPTVQFYERISINPENYSNMKVVELSIIDGFTLFDWLKVVENSKEIHMIETSLNYILETEQVKLKTNNINLYSRINDFHEVDYLFKLPWNYII